MRTESEENNYQYINPYEMMYKNMNFDVGETTTKETAEKIARQLGFMHNAFGIVVKDMIKIMSCRFGGEQEKKEEPGRDASGRRKKSLDKHRRKEQSEAMDVEEQEAPQEAETASKVRGVAVEEGEEVVVEPAVDRESAQGFV
jgi:hypothetical protein